MGKKKTVEQEASAPAPGGKKSKKPKKPKPEDATTAAAAGAASPSALKKKRLGGPPNGNTKGAGKSKKGSAKGGGGGEAAGAAPKSTKRLGGPPGGSTKQKKGGKGKVGVGGGGAGGGATLTKAQRKKQRAEMEKARKAEQARMLAGGGFSSSDDNANGAQPGGGGGGRGGKSGRGGKGGGGEREPTPQELEEAELQQARELAAKRRAMKAKLAARETAPAKTAAFAPALPPANVMERIRAKLAASDGDESVLTRKEKKLLEQHRRATEAAEAEALAAKDPLRFFTLSGLESSSAAGHANQKDVVIESFTIHAGAKCLFQDSSLRLIAGSRYGLVGPNGYGKTTVLRFLAERRLPIPAHVSCLHVEQEVGASHRSALATVLAADTERAALAADLERVHCMLDAVTAQAKVSGLEATLASLAQRLDALPAFELLDAPEAEDEDPREAKKRASERDLYIALKQSAVEAKEDLKRSREWLAHAHAADEKEAAAAVGGGGDGSDGDGDDDDDDDSEHERGDSRTATDSGGDLIEEMEKLYEALDAISADAAESRACKVLAGLGFSEEMQQRETFKFSGGWRMRISLARALFMDPDMLLLDEPTNHLDIDTVLWLEHYLKTEYEGTLLVVSHDQDFLSEVCTSMVLLDDRQLHFFNTTYDSFFDRQEQFVGQKQTAYEKQQKWINARLREAKGKLSRRDVEQQIEAGKFAEPEGGGSGKSGGGDVQPRLLGKPREYTVNFHFPEVIDETPYIDVDKVSFQYRPDLPLLFKNLDFPVNCATKATIVGPNGAGKSTLLQVINGDLNPTSGSVNRKGNLRVGYFNQHFDDVLDLDASGVEFLMKAHPTSISSQQVAHKFLGRFGLGTHAHRIPISQMSGGQKARVVFAHLAAQSPHLLLLDEPTNNLDIESINALIDGVNSFNGGVIIISHDARLIARTQMQLWLCDGLGNVKPMRVGFAKYREQVLQDHADRVEAQVRQARLRARSARKSHQKKINQARAVKEATAATKANALGGARAAR